ncbi:UDP-2,3-diacylglucosamine diphosphatase [Marinilabiliaceae bacterium JC017]|nr:UDP-2,3-diacylglucosamine diphosphatase [Marinilabiliaceae bacterium JC017]
MRSDKNARVRAIKAVVISDIHMGTYGCKANELLNYLKSISPELLVLNGDIIDIWQFSKSFFPKSHLKLIRQILKMLDRGTKVFYIPGNHDEALRRFVGLRFGDFAIENKVVLNLDGKKTWIFHGDVFDVVMHHSKWLAKLGAKGYGILTIINRFVNGLLNIFGQRKISLSRDIKNAVKGTKSLTTRFERTVADLAIKKGYDYAICGHIHWPENKTITNHAGSVVYLNSGDWVENLSALEYYNNEWHLKFYDESTAAPLEDEPAIREDFVYPSEKKLFRAMFRDVVSS